MSKYQNLFNHMANEHGLTLLESEMQDIIHECSKIANPVSDEEIEKAALGKLPAIISIGKARRMEQYLRGQVEGFKLGAKWIQSKQGDGWISVEDRLPEVGVPVIVFGINEHNKKRTLRAFYASKYSLEDSCINDSDWSDYNDLDDTYYIPKGWYEKNEYEDTNFQIEFKITHWQPLPNKPSK